MAGLLVRQRGRVHETVKKGMAGLLVRQRGRVHETVKRVWMFYWPGDVVVCMRQ